MMDFIKQIIEFLNSCAGLLSLLAVLAAIIVPIVIYKKQRQSERQDLQDELDAMNEVAKLPFYENAKKYYLKKGILEKKLKRK